MVEWTNKGLEGLGREEKGVHVHDRYVHLRCFIMKLQRVGIPLEQSLRGFGDDSRRVLLRRRRIQSVTEIGKGNFALQLR